MNENDVKKGGPELAPQLQKAAAQRPLAAPLAAGRLATLATGLL
jgi:hypothetical protein